MQVPRLVRMSQEALQEGKCVVIGLQSTGEARTADVVAERGEYLDDYVSGPRVTPPHPTPPVTSPYSHVRSGITTADGTAQCFENGHDRV